MRRWLLPFVTALTVVGCGGGEGAIEPPDAEQVVEQLKAEGLPIAEVQVLTAGSDANHLLGRPHQYTGKVLFADTRVREGDSLPELTVDDGGTVEVFADERDAEERKTFIDALAKNALFAQYVYLQDLVLLRVASELTPDQAAEYEAALATVDP